MRARWIVLLCVAVAGLAVGGVLSVQALTKPRKAVGGALPVVCRHFVDKCWQGGDEVESVTGGGACGDDAFWMPAAADGPLRQVYLCMYG